ncbi:hypothetical protein FGADI_13200 [Fusarium gaditjirri]|uniref:Ankyrin n=1 Tax=Fusarium gaditjirri TaxID=282569 RepID=A0A8H4WN73_9HYPO|nr:hypothetical protein FGADI_13200 [Fusarium gaditjirri]
MLDQRHPNLPKPPHDNNTYTLGSVGKHCVVIACLPKGKIGTISAATVTSSTISTFPTIKFCLMVGIGGGIPPKVRLGDVVVGTPVGAFPGVVQYDLGKAHQGGKFERTGALNSANSAPNSLLAALTMVESEHELTGSRIPEYLKEMEQKWPRLAPKYLKSDSLKDQLFKSDYAHISKSAAEGTIILVDDQEAEESDAEDDCRFCDTSQTVKRKPREMRVHYGLIASGNEVIKDSIFREKLNRDLGAAVAATLAKELLGQVEASDVGREPTANEVLGQMHEALIHSDKNIMEVKRKMDRKEGVDILEWLTPVNYGPQQSDYFSQREKGTGEWLLSSKEFQEWVENGQTLFCPGVPGAGKTIVTSIVINELTTRFGDDETVGIAYIYGNYRRTGEQTLDHLLKSLLKQLVQGQSFIPESVKSLYDKHSVRETRASLEEASATIQSISGLYSQIYIIVDALNELKAIDGCRNRLLEEIFKLQAQCGAKLFATSRFIPEIMDKFEGSTAIKIRADDEDVRSFLDSKISQSGQLSQTHREMVKTEIAKAVDGMFLLAQLYFQSVSTKKTLKKIKDALKSLYSGPKAYDIAYQKAMERIGNQDLDSKGLATKVLSWITCTKRVLTTSELQHALAVEESDVELDKENLPQIDDMVSVCAGLVTFDKESNVIRLVHYTTQEYLDRTRNEWFPNAETEITMACISYLSFDAFRGGCVSLEHWNPFYHYACRNWGHHALMALMDGDQRILDFLESPARLSASVQAIMPSIHHRWQDIPHMATEVPTAAYFGLSKTVLALLNKGHVADSKGIYGWTPLSYAATYGHEDVVKVLVFRKDVDPNSKDEICGWTPLSWAARYGHINVVRVLLDKEGVLADYVDGQDRTPLSLAAENGHEAVVSLLLSIDTVDPNSTDWRARTPLYWAAKHGHTGVTKLLLDKRGVLADYRDVRGRTPLSFAAENGHKAVVRLLLAMDSVDANSKGSLCGLTPLDYAVEGGHETVVKLLLTQTTVTWSGSLLESAVGKGHERVLMLLANSSTIPDCQGLNQQATIQAISSQDRYLSPSLLGQATLKRTNLHLAVENRGLALVETLLRKGAAINAPKIMISKWASGKTEYISESSQRQHFI